MGFTYFWSSSTLDTLFSTTRYLTVSTTTPQKDGTGVTEPGEAGFARVAVESGDWDVAASGVKSNSSVIAFGVSGADWGTLTYACFYDALSGGNLLAFGAFTPAVAVPQNYQLSFAVGDLQVTLDS